MAYRQTYLKVNLAAIRHNIKAARYLANKEVIGVIKANGYGIGAVPIAKVLIQEGAVLLAVSSLDEAMHLRKNNIRKDILVLGYVDPKDIPVAIKNNIILTATSLDWIIAISSLDPLNLRVHIKIDTKMNRLGITNMEDWQTALVLLKKLAVKLEGAYTHYAYGEEDNNQTTRAQFRLFKQYIQSSNVNFKWIHASNSDACFHFKDDDLSNAVRLGIGLYGYSKYHDDLIPALALYTQVALLKHVPAGQTVSYNCTYTATKDEIIATLPIGYADGFFRKNQGRFVFINDAKAQLVGRICMDQCMIRLDKEAKVGDEVEIFGPHIKLADMAAELDTTIHEVISLIAERVTHIYYEEKLTKTKKTKE